ncbi:MAG TPA: hypothetical protein VEA18_00575 [Candidatus Kapabacteria bacterium]|nr:hypothetical protein [Candidatus Kapabacteria bacterium]
MGAAVLLRAEMRSIVTVIDYRLSLEERLLRIPEKVEVDPLVTKAHQSPTDAGTKVVDLQLFPMEGQSFDAVTYMKRQGYDAGGIDHLVATLERFHDLVTVGRFFVAAATLIQRTCVVVAYRDHCSIRIGIRNITGHGRCGSELFWIGVR